METIKLQGRSEGAGSSTTYFPARTVSSFFSLLVLWRREVARRSNPLVGFFHPNFIQVERVQFHTSSSTTYDKILFTDTFVCSAPASPIWKSPIPPPPTLCVLCSQTRQIFRTAKRRRQPTCALRWIALLTFASPKTHNKVKEGVRGPETYFTLFGTGTATTTRQQGLYSSLGLHFTCNWGTILLHRSIPILSIVRVAQNLDTREFEYRQAASRGQISTCIRHS